MAETKTGAFMCPENWFRAYCSVANTDKLAVFITAAITAEDASLAVKSYLSDTPSRITGATTDVAANENQTMADVLDVEDVSPLLVQPFAIVSSGFYKQTHDPSVRFMGYEPTDPRLQVG